MNVLCKYDKLVPVGQLKPHPKNRNKHPKGQIKRLSEILAYQGIRAPIVVSQRSGFICKGHGTLEAIVLAGGKKAPVVYQKFDDDTQEYAFVQSDNAIASWADLDMAGLNADLGDLGPELNVDLLGIRGFTVDLFDKQPAPEKTLKPPARPKTKPGELWTLGSHRLLCADSSKGLERLVGKTRVSAVISDPPYGIDWDTDYTRFTGGVCDGRKNTKKIANDAAKFDPTPWLEYPAVVLFGSNFFADRLPVGTWLVWDKRFKNGTAFLSDAELAWMKGGKGVYICAITSQGFVRPEKIDHPTQKPVQLMEWCMAKAKAGKVVLDPFSGSGSTLMACEKTDRQCLAMEIDPGYCDVILNRWASTTGRSPIREDGKTWSQVRG